MSKFLEEMRAEARVRVQQYRKERDQLSNAAARIAELDALILEAEEEFGSLDKRIPEKGVKVDSRG